MASARQRDSTLPIALVALGLGWLASAVGTMGFLDVVRDRLHFLCAFTRQGSDDPGSWFCADGISYIGVGVATGLVLTAVAIAALLVLGTRKIPGRSFDRFRAAHGPERLLLLLSAVPGAYAIVSTAYAASTVDVSQIRNEVPDGLWWSVMGGASILLAVGAIAALAVAFIPSRVARWIDCALVVLAVLVVPVADGGLVWITPLPMALVLSSIVLESDPAPVGRQESDAVLAGGNAAESSVP